MTPMIPRSIPSGPREAIIRTVGSHVNRCWYGNKPSYLLKGCGHSSSRRALSGRSQSWNEPNSITVGPRRSVATFSTKSGESSNIAFDRRLKVLQRNGAARSDTVWSEHGPTHGDDVVEYDYIRTEIATRLVDRLDDIKREGGFPLALDIGAGAGHIHRAICADDAFEGVGGIGGIRKLVQLDSSSAMLHRDDDAEIDGRERCSTYKLVADEEGTLPFPDGTFDLVTSSMALHWVNDLPHLLTEIRRVLKPDGCLIFAIVGGSTLPELRSSLVLAEMERDGGVSPHVGPFVDFGDVGSLLTAAGFALPTVDIDTIKIGYPNALVLMEHLQRMGESNASLNRKVRVGTNTFIAAACIYDEMFKLETECGVEDDCVEASVQIIYAIGWTPHESQQKPRERGSATHKVGDVVITQTERGED